MIYYILQDVTTYLLQLLETGQNGLNCRTCPLPLYGLLRRLKERENDNAS